MEIARVWPFWQFAEIVPATERTYSAFSPNTCAPLNWLYPVPYGNLKL